MSKDWCTARLGPLFCGCASCWLCSRSPCLASKRIQPVPRRRYELQACRNRRQLSEGVLQGNRSGHRCCGNRSGDICGHSGDTRHETALAAVRRSLLAFYAETLTAPGASLIALCRPCTVKAVLTHPTTGNILATVALALTIGCSLAGSIRDSTRSWTR